MFNTSAYLKQLNCQRVPNEIWWTFHMVLARFARNDLHALPETLHALPETLNGLHETLHDSHETLNGLHETLNGLHETFLTRNSHAFLV